MIFKDRSSQCRSFKSIKKKGVNYKAEALSIIILRRALIIPEKRVMYVVSIVLPLPGAHDRRSV